MKCFGLQRYYFSMRDPDAQAWMRDDPNNFVYTKSYSDDRRNSSSSSISEVWRLLMSGLCDEQDPESCLCNGTGGV